MASSEFPAQDLGGPLAARSTWGDVGVFDALANYWLTRLRYEETDEPLAVPQYNLAESAGEALGKLVDSRGYAYPVVSAFSGGFDLALRFVDVLSMTGVHTGPALKELLRQKVPLLDDDEKALAARLDEAYDLSLFKDSSKALNGYALDEPLEAPVDALTLGPSMIELGDEFARVAFDFQGIADRLKMLAEHVAKRQATAQEIPPMVYDWTLEATEFFHEGAVPNYDFESIELACDKVRFLVQVLSGRLVMRDGSYVDPNSPPV